MQDTEMPTDAQQAGASQVAFDYIKASDFRTVWADGAIGGVTPAGLIHCAVYSERPAIPQRQIYEIVDDPSGVQRLGQEIATLRISREAIVREMPIDIFMSIQTAENIARWLLEQIEVVKSMAVAR